MKDNAIIATGIKLNIAKKIIVSESMCFDVLRFIYYRLTVIREG